MYKVVYHIPALKNSQLFKLFKSEELAKAFAKEMEKNGNKIIETVKV